MHKVVRLRTVRLITEIPYFCTAKCTIGDVVGDMAYCLTPKPLTRDETEIECLAWGGHLATVSSQDVFNNIKNMGLWTCNE